MKQLRVTIEGKVYEVTVESLEGGSGASAPVAQPALSAAPVQSGGAAMSHSSGAPGEVVSPLAGKVVAIQVTKGQAVKQGDQLVVLEAMKMNTYILAPQDGTVTEVVVNVGDAVADGQVVLKIG
jgi:glutaconyl-CoA/methylmalonyl-CoA decarboxylase subunit gamma